MFSNYTEDEKVIRNRWARWQLGGYGWLPLTDDEREQVGILENITEQARKCFEEKNMLNWHNHIIFDVDAMAEHSRKNSAELKERIDARAVDAQARVKQMFGH